WTAQATMRLEPSFPSPSGRSRPRAGRRAAAGNQTLRGSVLSRRCNCFRRLHSERALMIDDVETDKRERADCAESLLDCVAAHITALHKPRATEGANGLRDIDKGRKRKAEHGNLTKRLTYACKRGVRCGTGRQLLREE